MYKHMIFQIEVFESSARLVDVEAEDADQAFEKVREMYNKEEIVLDYSDFQDVEFNIINVTQ